VLKDYSAAPYRVSFTVILVIINANVMSPDGTYIQRKKGQDSLVSQNISLLLFSHFEQ